MGDGNSFPLVVCVCVFQVILAYESIVLCKCSGNVLIGYAIFFLVSTLYVFCRQYSFLPLTTCLIENEE